MSDFFTQLRSIFSSDDDEEEIVRQQAERRREYANEQGIQGAGAERDAPASVTRRDEETGEETVRRGRFVPTEEFDERDNFISRLFSRVPTPEADSGGEQALTALEGYGDTVTLGGRSRLQSMLPGESLDEVRRESGERIQRNPLAYAGGVGAGIGASMLAGGGGAASGVARLGRAVLDPVGSAARAAPGLVRGARALAAGRQAAPAVATSVPAAAAAAGRAAQPASQVRRAAASPPPVPPPRPPASPPPVPPPASAAPGAVNRVVQGYGTAGTRVAPPGYPRSPSAGTQVTPLQQQVTRNVGAVPTRVSGPPPRPPGAPATRVSGPFGGNVPGQQATQVRSMIQNLPTAVRGAPTPRGSTPHMLPRTGSRIVTQAGPLQLGRAPTLPRAMQSSSTVRMMPTPRGPLPAGARPVGVPPRLPPAPSAAPTTVNRIGAAPTTVNRLSAAPTTVNRLGAAPTTVNRIAGAPTTVPRVPGAPTTLFSRPAAQAPGALQRLASNLPQSSRAVAATRAALPAAAGIMGRTLAESGIAGAATAEGSSPRDIAGGFAEGVGNALTPAGFLASAVGLKRGVGAARRASTGNTAVAEQIAQRAERARDESSRFLRAAGANADQIKSLTRRRGQNESTPIDGILSRLRASDPRLVSAMQRTETMRGGLRRAARGSSQVTQDILQDAPAQDLGLLNRSAAQLRSNDLTAALAARQPATVTRMQQEALNRAAQELDQLNITNYGEFRTAVNEMARRGNQFVSRSGKLNETEEAGALGAAMAANALRDVERSLLTSSLGPDLAQRLSQSRQRTTDLINLEPLAENPAESISILAAKFFAMGLGVLGMTEAAGEGIEQATGGAINGAAANYILGTAAVLLGASAAKDMPQASRGALELRNRLMQANPDVAAALQRTVSTTAGGTLEDADRRSRAAADAVSLIMERELSGQSEPVMLNAMGQPMDMDDPIVDYFGAPPVRGGEDQDFDDDAIIDYDYDATF